MTGEAITTRGWVADEARALLARVSRVHPLVLQEATTPAAAPDPRALRAIELSLREARGRVGDELRQLVRWLATPEARDAGGEELQVRLVRARMSFNDALSDLDVFADALSQRSERDAGLWLAGLDAVAEDAIAQPGAYEAPPVLCYLDRGPGAAIRRARTRLPGGGVNPVALIQIPRERMTGTAVAVSLAHEIGHQAAALLRLVEALRARLPDPWQRWTSEIVADLWALARLGPTAASGLVGILSLPTYFVFRIGVGDPHPPPWLRVRLGLALGHGLYPDDQWRDLAALWDELYPLASAPPAQRDAFAELDHDLPHVRDLVLGHRCRALAHATVGEAIALVDRSPAALRGELRRAGWRRRLANERPARALAIVGQARWMRAITPEDERRTVANLLATWAVRRALHRTVSTTN